jgi:hypothetical protein
VNGELSAPVNSPPTPPSTVTTTELIHRGSGEQLPVQNLGSTPGAIRRSAIIVYLSRTCALYDEPVCILSVEHCGEDRIIEASHVLPAVKGVSVAFNAYFGKACVRVPRVEGQGPVDLSRHPVYREVTGRLGHEMQFTLDWITFFGNDLIEAIGLGSLIRSSRQLDVFSCRMASSPCSRRRVARTRKT